jgi:hypothetical protein
MKASELAKELNLSRSQIARRAVTIPGHRLTRGGHHRFLDCPKLQRWIKENRISKRGRWVTLPLEAVIEHYSSSYLKTLNRDEALAFFEAAHETSLNLEEKRQWLVRNFKPKR